MTTPPGGRRGHSGGRPVGSVDPVPVRRTGPRGDRLFRLVPVVTAGGRRRARYDALAVDVPARSLPQNGCDETGVNPLDPAFITQVQSFESWPKMVE
jgi:hypothetical protein